MHIFKIHIQILIISTIILPQNAYFFKSCNLLRLGVKSVTTKFIVINETYIINHSRSVYRMDEKKYFELLISGEYQMEAVLKCNDYTQKFGLTLTKEDVMTLINERKDSLKEQQRVEFGEGILPKLIFSFCDSAYITQDNYVETICMLQDIFYLYKNESLDELNDDELVEFMKDTFEHECQGSLEYLEDTKLEEFARNIRASTRKFIGRYAIEESDDTSSNKYYYRENYYGDDYE